MNIRNVIFALLCPALLTPCSFRTMGLEHSAQIERKTIEPISIENQTIYTANMVLPSGEVAYFASEPIFDEDRACGWRTYRQATDDLVNNCGILRSGIIIAHENLGEFHSGISRLNCFSPDSQYKDQFFKLFDSYILSLGKRNLSEVETPFKGIASGICGMRNSIGCRINYISKKPVVSLFNFPNQPPRHQNLDDYMSAYDDLVMSVSTFHHKDKMDGDSYEHRGIFRNPLSMLRRDYKGLALSLHAFSACAWHSENPQVKFMIVEPDSNAVMRKLLLKEFGYDELSSSDHPTSDEELRQFHEKNGIDIAIKIGALEKRF